jgi:hypothetical protein
VADARQRAAAGRPLSSPVTAAGNAIRHGTGPFVLTLAGARICAMTRFDNSVLPSFTITPRPIVRFRGRSAPPHCIVL